MIRGRVPWAVVTNVGIPNANGAVPAAAENAHSWSLFFIETGDLDDVGNLITGECTRPGQQWTSLPGRTIALAAPNLRFNFFVWRNPMNEQRTAVTTKRPKHSTCILPDSKQESFGRCRTKHRH